MEKIKKEPAFFLTVIILLLLFAGLYFARIAWQEKKEIKGLKQAESEFGYEYGTLVPKQSGLMNADTFVKLGFDALEDNRFDDAKELFKFGTAHFPDNADLWFGLSEAYINEGDKKEAVKYLDQAALIEQKDSFTWYRLSQLYYLTDHFQESYKAIQKAVSLEPDNQIYLKSMAQIANLNDDYSVSEGVYEQILAQDPENKEIAFALGKVSAWAKQPQKIDHQKVLLKEGGSRLETDNSFQFEELMNEYRILYGETPEYQILQAEYLYKNYLKKYPKDSQGWYQLANVYYEFNQPHLAWKAVEKALSLNRSNLSFLQLKADIAYQLNKNEERVQTYEQMLSIDPDQPKIRLELAIIRATQTVAITPELIRSNPFLTEAILAIDQKDFTAAINQLDLYAKVVGTDPLYQSLITLIAVSMDKCAIAAICSDEKLIEITKAFLQSGGDLRDSSYVIKQKAELVAQQAICRDPCSIDKLNLYAEAIRLLEIPPLTDFVIAQRIYSDILGIDPCNHQALRNLARVTALYGELDEASTLYELYVRQVGFDCLSPEATIEYANVLESQGNNHLALRYLGHYSCHFDQNQDYLHTLAHQLNSADRPSAAFIISNELLQENNCDYEAWLNYTRSAALLNYPCASLYGLSQIQTLQPANPLTIEAQWLVLLPLLSNINFGGTFFQSDQIGLTFWKESLSAAYTIWPGTQLTAGFSGFETYAALDNVVILGLGDLQQRNGRAWAGEFSGWLGFNTVINRYFLANFRIGAGHTNADSELTTIEYGADLFFPLCDNLDINLNSSYGFLLYTPKNLSLFIRDWSNEFVVDFWPTLNIRLLSMWDLDLLTDGNQLLEITIYPRYTVYAYEHWKWVLGLMGNWLTARKEVEHGYYSPHLYQGYGAELLIDYIIDDFSVIKLNSTIGLQKDTFNFRFGFLGNVKLEVLYNLTLHWYVGFEAEYLYLDTSTGYYDSMEFSGVITHRF